MLKRQWHWERWEMHMEVVGVEEGRWGHGLNIVLMCEILKKNIEFNSKNFDNKYKWNQMWGMNHGVLNIETEWMSILCKFKVRTKR